MPISATSIDPLARFLEAIIRGANRQPIPLLSTRIDVTIRGGLATVTTERTFRNTEKISIEATMTFPVPVDATVCALTAKIDGRTLNAVAQARVKARETYEEAVDKGKSAVLHEELLKGIHMLSVGHVGPGAEIAVTDTWTAPLSFTNATPQLRIPTTVGEIYGRSPLPACDELISADATHKASIGIVCENGAAWLMRAGSPTGGRYTITLDQPIDIAVAGWTQRVLHGVAADGRTVTLDITPAPKLDAALDVAILFDHSGSMGEYAQGDKEVSATKFDVAKSGLIKTVRESFQATDRLRIWQFDDRVDFLGEASGAACAAVLQKIRGPAGGTEIGQAFEVVITSENAKNIVVITDGKSWALDAQKLARTGIRVNAVLIGEDAIESGIAHLAGMTGGQVFVAAGSDAGNAVASALNAARMPFQLPAEIPGAPSQVETLRRGARITAIWGSRAEGEASIKPRQIGAAAAMLAIPLMSEEAAAKLAEAEGIVCHLTSLVLVDEASATHALIPAVRKVPLSTPLSAKRMAMSTGLVLSALSPDEMAARALALASPSDGMKYCMEPDPDSYSRASGRSKSLSLLQRLSKHFSPVDDAPLAPSAPQSVGSSSPASPSLPAVNLARLVSRIDWETDPDALRNGDLSSLSPDLIAAIQAAAQLPEIVAFANAAGIDRVIAVVGLLARAAGGKSRTAQRIARAILGRASASNLKAAMSEVGL